MKERAQSGNVIKKYKNEQYRLDVYKDGVEYSTYSAHYDELRQEADKLAKDGAECEIWELIEEFK